ncbi:MAG: questin oxidase family protein [Myxococcales bacterium]|nr:questin oxidase family protein [Myxococcales bacterium]
MDIAWERFHQTGLEWGDGFANHGPMAAQALEALGHPSLIPGFVDRYAPRLPPAQQGHPLAEDERAGALGVSERSADWVATWEQELARRPWPEVVAEVVPGLLPGVFASAAHGLLRTMHAVRGLAETDTPVRRRELAHGLGVWAGTYQELPGTPGSAASAGSRRLTDLAPVSEALRSGGAFTERVGALDSHAAYAEWVAALDLEGEPGGLLSELVVEAAGLYLQHPNARIAYCHAVTAPAAVRVLAPLLPGDAVRQAIGRAYQAAGALHAISFAPCPPDPEERSEAERMKDDPRETRYRAACSLDDHAIKLAEACLREDSLAGAPELRLAAADAALHMGGPQRSC